MREYINNDWEFTESFTEALLDPDFRENLERVRIPHTVKELPLHYFDEKCCQLRSGYRRSFFVPESWQGQRVLVTFEGVAHGCRVWCNALPAGEHRCGYTAFTLELTELLRYGKENYITLEVDSRESQNLPPFGHVIDYLTYGGIYRNVFLELRPECFVADVYVQPEVSGALRSIVCLDGGPDDSLRLRQRVWKRGAEAGPPLAEKRFLTATPSPGQRLSLRLSVPAPELWDLDTPNLYTLETALLRDGTVIDTSETVFGFRSSEFRADGYYLNGRKVRLRGLNRHQSYPYVGYAMPRSMQRLDAEILKRELGVNAVRTSHYPQSQDFITRCDELGLLVFTEIPGWQHIGDADWQEQAVVNVEEMVTQYRNHPSVILWGVRINESQDNDDLYRRTNERAHALDPTRPTGGVRYLKKSSFLEDVYTFNDFIHDGSNSGCQKKSAVTPDMSRAYLISEYNGHMYPTKAFDSEVHRTEHALRHARVLNAVAGEPDIAGSFGWCMFDYNTHRDFGSGDRICYHGVLDMFRNPKTAAWVYASQQEETPVLHISSGMDIGEQPGSLRGDVWIFTNADSVRMYRGGSFIKEFRREDSPFSSLPHGPLLIDDYIGERMREQEGMKSAAQNALVKDLLNSAARYGMNRLPAGMKARAAAAMAGYRMRVTDAYRLYEKYIGSWGGEAEGFRFEAIRNGTVVAETVCTAAGRPALHLDLSHTVLTEGDSYDVAALRVRVCDENGNTLPFWNTPLPVTVEGPAVLIGCGSLIPVSGGMGGAYLKTTGSPGPVRLRLSLPGAWDPTGEAAVTAALYVRLAGNGNIPLEKQEEIEK